MKQIIQNLKSGETKQIEVPVPLIQEGHVLIKTTRTLVSLGTERMLVEFGKASMLSKAKKQPDKVKMVLDKIRTDGLRPTIDSVFNKLDEPIPMGYNNVGVVMEIGKGVKNIQMGDRVVSNGPHAEYVLIPEKLVAKIPDNVSDEQAAFTVLGSIGLQGIRLLKPTFGETFVVYGLGLIGLLSLQLLKANGCNIIGIDIAEDKLKLAESFGAVALDAKSGVDLPGRIMRETDGYGADGVLITASSKDNEIISQSAKMCRKRGRIVLVGVTGLNISRADFYEKEISFQVSCSYGPGRYDDEYELKGRDYPLPFVRWTENRNFKAVLKALANGSLNVDPLITEILPFDRFEEVYKNISASKAIATIFKFSEASNDSKRITIGRSEKVDASKNVCIAVVGVGNFAKMTLLPALSKLKACVKYLCDISGVASTTLAKKYKIDFSVSDIAEVLNDDEVNLVIITTRHNSHAELARAALEAGKHVFVEKPLALNEAELQKTIEVFNTNNQLLTVGFNRRFAPAIMELKKYISNFSADLNMVATINAGFIPKQHWVHDMEIGGGRIIGEACHFIDLLAFLADSPVKAVFMTGLGINPKEDTDNAIITLKFENGAQGVVNYFANGSKTYSKERIEVFGNGKVFIIDNFRKIEGYGVKGFSKIKYKQDKGHFNQFKTLIDALSSGDTNKVVSLESVINTTRASFAALESMKTKQWVTIE